jgi:hypothetical protein
VSKEKKSIQYQLASFFAPFFYLAPSMAWPLLLSAAGGALFGAGAMVLAGKRNKKR